MQNDRTQTSPPWPDSATSSVPFGVTAGPRGLSSPFATGVTVQVLPADQFKPGPDGRVSCAKR